jgi:hypothetical protein
MKTRTTLLAAALMSAVMSAPAHADQQYGSDLLACTYSPDNATYSTCSGIAETNEHLRNIERKLNSEGYEPILPLELSPWAAVARAPTLMSH